MGTMAFICSSVSGRASGSALAARRIFRFSASVGMEIRRLGVRFDIVVLVYRYERVKACRSQRESLPFLIPDQPSRPTVDTAWLGSALRRRAGTHSSSSRRIGCQTLASGFEHRYCSRPRDRWKVFKELFQGGRAFQVESNRFFTGTRVPVKQSAPLMISRSRLTRDASMVTSCLKFTLAGSEAGFLMPRLNSPQRPLTTNTNTACQQREVPSKG